MQNSTQIVNRIMVMKGWKNSGPLMDYFKVARSTVSSWRSRDSIPFKYITLFCEREGVPIQELINPELTLDTKETPEQLPKSVAESRLLYESQLSSFFPLTNFGDAVDKFRVIYESNNHILTAGIMTALSAGEFSLKLIDELSNIKARISRLESILNKHKPPKNTGERRKAWLEIQKNL